MIGMLKMILWLIWYGDEIERQLIGEENEKADARSYSADLNERVCE